MKGKCGFVDEVFLKVDENEELKAVLTGVRDVRVSLRCRVRVLISKVELDYAKFRVEQDKRSYPIKVNEFLEGKLEAYNELLGLF